MNIHDQPAITAPLQAHSAVICVLDERYVGHQRHLGQHQYERVKPALVNQP